MRFRTRNPNGDRAKYYYDKGIRVCDEWSDFENFKKWSLNNGYSDKLTIDRIDSDGNYCPENCRWVTKKENNQNKKKQKDYGIFKKKKGYYVQIIIDGVFYCGGYSCDIDKAREYKNNLLKQIENKEPIDMKRKRLRNSSKDGRFVWE